MAKQNKIREWLSNAIFLVIVFFIFLKIVDSLCKIDEGFCRYSLVFVGALVSGIYFYIRYGLINKTG